MYVRARVCVCVCVRACVCVCEHACAHVCMYGNTKQFIQRRQPDHTISFGLRFYMLCVRILYMNMKRMLVMLVCTSKQEEIYFKNLLYFSYLHTYQGIYFPSLIFIGKLSHD
jgi:hypothetical protein